LSFDPTENLKGKKQDLTPSYSRPDPVIFVGDTFSDAGTSIFWKMPCWRVFRGGLKVGVSPVGDSLFFAHAKEK
jgi:hypothetical protein